MKMPIARSRLFRNEDCVNGCLAIRSNKGLNRKGIESWTHEDWLYTPSQIYRPRVFIPPANLHTLRRTLSAYDKVSTCLPKEISRSLNKRWFAYDIHNLFDRGQPDSIIWMRHSNSQVWWPFKSISPHTDSIINYILSKKPNTNHKMFPIKKPIEHWLTPNVVYIDSLLSDIELTRLTNYYMDLKNTGYLQFGDKQTARRYWAHNESVCRFMHYQMADIAFKLTSLALSPTFCSVLIYEENSDLRCHLDRCEAEFTLSLQLAYFIQGRRCTNSWPISVERIPNSSQYWTGLVRNGSAIAFFGKDHRHYRSTLPDGHSSLILCFHFAKKYE